MRVMFFPQREQTIVIYGFHLLRLFFGHPDFCFSLTEGLVVPSHAKLSSTTSFKFDLNNSCRVLTWYTVICSTQSKFFYVPKACNMHKHQQKELHTPATDHMYISLLQNEEILLKDAVAAFHWLNLLEIIPVSRNSFHCCLFDF
jgi:hypothetical protein